MPILQNPETLEIRIVNDPSGLLAQGWHEPTPEQADQAAKEVDFGGLGEQAQAQGERVLRGATLGLARGFGDDADIEARAEVSQKQHPVLSFAADVAPQVGIAALTGGLGEAAALGAGAARGGLAAGAASLAAESVGGALVGAGQAAYERGQYLGEDPGKDAENALIFGGLSFGLGAAGHALFGGAAGKGASRFAKEGAEESAEKATIQDVAKAAEQEAAERAPAGLPEQPVEMAGPLSEAEAKAARIAELSRGFNEATGLEPVGTEVPGAQAAVQRQAEQAAVEDGMDRALSNASRSEAQDTLEEAIGAKVPSPEADSLERQRRLYQNRDAILDVATREMKADVGAVLKDVPELESRSHAAAVAKNVSGDLASQRVVADGVAKNAAELAGSLRGEARAYAAASGSKGLQYQVLGTKRLVQDLMAHAEALTEAKTGKALFTALDDFGATLRESDLPQARTLASQMRTALEDGAVWGKAGEQHAAYNAVLLDQLEPALQGLDASKVTGLIKARDLGQIQQANAALDALDQLASVRSQYGDAAAGTRMADQVAKIRRTMGLAEEVQDASQRMGALGQVAGAVPIVGGLTKEWVTGDLANAFRRLSGAVDRGIDRGVDDWIASSRVRGDSGSLLGNVALKTARAVTGADDSAIAQIARRQGISHGLARFMGSDETPQAAFNRARAALQSDEQFFAAMGQDYKSLQEYSPETYLMLSGSAAKARAFLLQRMPTNVQPSMTRPDGYPPHRDSIEDFAIYWNAVKEPMRVVSNIRSARIQEIQTLQAVYPRLYERTQMRVLQKVAGAQLAGKPLDDALLMRLNLLFPDVDGAGSPAFSRQVGQMARDYNAAQQQMQRASGKAASPRAALSSSPVGGIAQTGATFGVGP